VGLRESSVWRCDVVCMVYFIVASFGKNFDMVDHICFKIAKMDRTDVVTNRRCTVNKITVFMLG